MTLAVEIAEARPRVIAALATRFRDLDTAEDAFAAACEALLAQGQQAPDNVAGWLYRVALRKAVDTKRKAGRERAASEAAAIMSEQHTIITLPDPIPDERLKLLFVCCHPALAPEARVAMALKVVCGTEVEDIARAFAVSVPTMYQRITRAKAKIAAANIPFELPHRREWPSRIASVLGALEVSYLQTYGPEEGADRSGVAADVLSLAQMLCELLPDDSEAKGFCALLLITGARLPARLDDDGAMVPLSRQDTSRWDHAMIEQGRILLDEAALVNRPGPYQVLAAIQLTHSARLAGGEVNWEAIAELYDALLVMRPGPIVAINRSLAVAEVEGAAAGLETLDAIDVSRLTEHRPLCVARARLLEKSGKAAAAKAMVEKALAADPPPPEKLFLERWRDRISAV
ncbi:RNA polymerase sigma factor [Aurantiacibacter sp. MUD61]|uniref:RNA polymerase sigma factor n=1 Tax=Aurantiacibacter sp. MUD61 TaxID=3009083 RepID=UPI0022F135CE|nr:DUF6596 domain-containing protein [Aurantiacibacter sp. MUD61]